MSQIPATSPGVRVYLKAEIEAADAAGRENILTQLRAKSQALHDAYMAMPLTLSIKVLEAADEAAGDAEDLLRFAKTCVDQANEREQGIKEVQA